MGKKTYEEADNEISKLFMNGKFDEAVKLLEAALTDFPDKFASINLDLAFVYLRTGDIKRSADRIQEALARGFLYPKQYFKKELGRDEFKALLPEWDRLLEEAKKNQSLKWSIKKPQGFNADKKYPLFLAIHGWGEDLELFSRFWNSDDIEKNYILAMPQSSQIMGTFNYCWDDLELAHKDIKDFYSILLKEYNIDTDNIIVGGFSQGATIALDIALNHDYIPVKGVVSLNPSKPEHFDDNVLANAKKKDIKLCIITGDQDGDYPAQKEMKEAFDKTGVKYTLSVKEQWGHWFPEDLGYKIDAAIKFIQE